MSLACLEDFILTLLQDFCLATPIIDCDSFIQAISDLQLQENFLLFTKAQIDSFSFITLLLISWLNMLLSLFLQAVITRVGQPTPCPRGCTEGDRWGTGFTTYTYVHRDCYASPTQPCSHGDKWFSMARSLGTAKSSSVSNCYKPRGKDLCFTMQTHYGVTDRKGTQDQR